jgi:selT/selW/selH-like putative selenoprotein
VEAELKAAYPDSDVALVKGEGGIFDVKCDGTLVYSKQQTARFPGEGEVAGLIKQKKAG